MLKFWCLLLLTFVLFEGIVCPGGEMLDRRDRSSYYDTKQNVNSYMDNLPNEYRSRKTQQQQQYDIDHHHHHHHHHHQQQQQQQQQLQQQQTLQQQQQLQEQQQSEIIKNMTIESIFKKGPGKGVVLFNTTSDPYLTPIPHMPADQSFIDKSSHQEQAFKVQRTPDGKLNLVFNDFLFLQRTPEARTTPLTFVPDFVYPDQKELILGTEPRCKETLKEGDTFCTNVHNYPTDEQLEAILRQEYTKFEAFFGEDFTQPQNISQRMNDDPEEEFFCKSRQKIVYPKLGLTKSLNWELIVNNDKNRQGVLIEECVHNNATCDFFQSIPLQYQTRCAQQVSHRLFVAILSNGTVVWEEFQFQSSCKCAFKLRNTSL